MPKNSLIDTDFIEESDEPFGLDDPHSEERKEFEDRTFDFDAPKRRAKNEDVEDDEDGEDERPKRQKKSKEDDLQIEVVDDTPDEDKGKWVADDNDPLEDVDDDEVKKYSKDVRERISKLTARAHAERRAKEERDRQMNEALTVAQRLLQENNKLKELVENGSKVLHGEHTGRLKSQLDAAKIAYREAAEASDTNGMLAAQEQIARIVSQMDRASSYQPQPLPREDEKLLERFRQQPQQQGPSQTALAWRDKNQWFDTDLPMRAFALAVHKTLVDGGVQPDTPDYYKQIDAEVRKRFPDRFQKEQQQRRRGTVVAPASRGNGGASPRKITLTESQVRIARRLNLTPEQYAKQLLAEQELGNGKEFTHSARR